MKIELIYDQTCPNVDLTRKQLKQALAELDLHLTWQEWDRNHPKSPKYAKVYGSPTVLINGKDVHDCEPSDENCCRIYLDENNRYNKAPSVQMLIQAIKMQKGN